MRSALGCAALGILLLLVAGTFDAEPLYVTGSALTLLGAGAACGSPRARGAPSVARELGARSVTEEEPLSVRIQARAGRLPLPPGYIDEPLIDEPVRFRAGRRRARVRVDVDVRPSRPAGARAARRSSSATRSGSLNASSPAASATRCSSCRGSSRCGRPAAAGRRNAVTAARR